MTEIVRFSVSLEADLLEQFDRYCKEGKFATRSEAVRQLLRETLTAHAWESDAQDAAATVKDEGQAAAQDVQGQAQQSKETVQSHATS